jgi:anaerobic selenocysteine-containing dehydrogenase
MPLSPIEISSPTSANAAAGVREVRSFCRFCTACCGTRVSVDADGRIVKVAADRDDLMTEGYACLKGLQAPAAHYGEDRILRPLKRRPDGTFVEIELETALDEIADKLRDTVHRHGVHAVGGFRGGGAVLNAGAGDLLHFWLQTLGSPKSFSTTTIDQSAKIISAGRLGIWSAGRVPLADSDVRMCFGVNPLVSLATSYFDLSNPHKRMKEARARGMKLIVIDPRRTETAQYADVFLQPYPGEDPTIAAGLLRIILTEGWEDAEFCTAHVMDLAQLRAAVEPFTPDYVARRAGILADDLRRAASLFARETSRGGASTGTGPSMAPHSNLSEHLVETLNVVCGRYMREGDKMANPGVFQPRTPRLAQAISPQRWWEEGYRGRIGNYGTLIGEMMTGTMADEILVPGDGQIRCFISHGSNLINTVPDRNKMVRALESLEMFVSIEPYMNETARLSHYIIPTKLQYERSDLSVYVHEQALLQRPFARYTSPVATPPAGSQLIDDHYFFWSICKRLRLTFTVDGRPFDMERPPTTDEVLSVVGRNLPVSIAELKSYPMGKIFDEEPQFVGAADPGTAGRFCTMPGDVAAELAAVAAESFNPGHSFSNGQSFTHRLTSRRVREVHNSTGRNIPAIRKRMPYNPAYLHPEDLIALGLSSGDHVTLTSDAGSIPAIVAADPTVRRGVVSMSHGFGGMPGASDYAETGSSTGVLISTDRDLDPINAMPRMSAIPVNITVNRAANSH